MLWFLIILAAVAFIVIGMYTAMRSPRRRP